MGSDSGSAECEGTALGRIPLKQMRVSRNDAAEARSASANPMNRLVPYLDLFGRLGDAELGRLAGVEPTVVGALRKQVIEVDRALVRYVDLLPRLSDAELVRLTGATEKTIRFWRLCQPQVRHVAAWSQHGESENAVVARSAASQATTAPMAAASPEPAPAGRSRPQPRKAAADKDDAAGGPAQPKGVPQPVPRGDSRITLHPAAQATVDSMMSFSGDPFPGYDDSEDPQPPPPDEVSLAQAETAQAEAKSE